MGLFPKDRNLAVAPEQVELRVRASDFQTRRQDLQVRLDTFLHWHLSWRSRSSIQRLVHDGFVLVDPAVPEAPRGKGNLAVETRPGRKLRDGSRVVVVIPEELRVESELPTSEDLAVIYEDRQVVVVDKPPLQTVHPAGRHLTDTLIQRLHARYHRDDQESLPFVKLCHRLDRETSGVVLSAKDARSHAFLMGCFENRRVEKEYLAIVWGAPREERGTIDLPLGPSRTSNVRLKMAPRPDGSPSRTDWHVVERYADCSLLACQLHTGRQHQIRVHLDAIGLPLVGDKLYGVDEELFLRASNGELERSELEGLGLNRHALHHHRLKFPSPVGGDPIEVRAPLARDMQRFLEQRA